MRSFPRAAAALVVAFVVAGVVGSLTITAAGDETSATEALAPAGSADPQAAPPADAEDVLAHAVALHDFATALDGQRRVEEAAALEALALAQAEADARAEAEREAALQAQYPARGQYPTRGPIPHDTYWDAMARCETGGDWAMTGSRYSGGVGFYNGTWDAWGGREFAPLAGQASREEQIIVANRVATQGWVSPSGGYVAPVGYSGWGCVASVGYP
jgi:hypothetical protein